MASALQAFHELGIPIEPDKSEGPTTTLTVLGIEVDTVGMQLLLGVATKAAQNANFYPSLACCNMQQQSLDQDGVMIDGL